MLQFGKNLKDEMADAMEVEAEVGIVAKRFNLERQTRRCVNCSRNSAELIRI